MTIAEKQIEGLMPPRQVRLPSLHVLVNFLVMQRPLARLYVSYRLGTREDPTHTRVFSGHVQTVGS